MVTRFNTKTWNEFLRYRDKKDIKGYIYGTPVRIKNNIPVDEILIVFEMHNDLNKVMGISLVKNYLRMDKIFSIYSDNNYNRYVYYGKKRVDREAMTEQENKIMEIFDIILFKGYTHLKRGQGISLIPEKLYNKYKIDDKTLTECLMKIFY